MKSNLYLINGPLGAGKTTLLKFLLKQDFLKNAQVIENEFASTSIDSEELHDHVKEVETIAGLCICCSTGTELVDVLLKLKDSGKPVIIEATGVANSLKLVEKLVVNDILNHYNIAKSFFVVDAAEAQDNASILKTHKDELEAADVVVVTKTDLLEEKVARETVSSIQTVAKGAVTVADMGVINPATLNDESRFLAYFAQSNSVFVNHDENINYSIIDVSTLAISADQIKNTWAVLQKSYSIKRLKGNIIDTDANHWHVEATPAQCTINTQTETSTLQLILIGEDARLITPTLFGNILNG